MAGNNKDINLTIRAKNEAERTVKAVAGALGTLDANQTQASHSADDFATSIDRMQSNLAKLEGAAKRQTTVTDQLTSATSRQAADLISTNRAIQERKARINELNRALTMLSVETDKAFIGPRRNGLTDTIRSIKTELKSAQTSLSGARGDGGLTLQYEKQIAKLGELRAALRGAQSVSREADGAVAVFTAEIANQTRALEANSDAARRAQAAQQFFNNRFASGLNNQANTATEQQEIAAILRVAQARDIEIQKLKATEAAAYEVARAKEAEARAMSLLPGALSGKSARDFASVFQTADADAVKRFETQIKAGAGAVKEEAAAIEYLRDRLNPLAVVEARVAAETQKLAQWQKQGKISADEQKAATKLLNDELERSKRAINGTQGLDSRGRPSLFGLKPYELQNLSFQVNDVFTQLASGTSLTQTLAQQGGQILQLFPEVGSAIAAGLTSAPLIAFTAGLATLVIGMREVAAESERIRQFGGLLAANADGNVYDPRKLNAAAEALNRYGISAEEAVATVRVFMKEGVDQSRIDQFARAAKDLSDVMGIELKDAAGATAEAFTGGFNAVKKLDDAYNFLTASQREQIKTLFDQGEAERARDMALAAFSSRMDSAADKARGPWSAAFRELGSAWQEFTRWLGDLTVVKGAAESLANLAGAAATAIRSLRNAGSAAGTLEDIATKRKQIALLEAKVRSGRSTNLDKISLADARRGLQYLEAQLAALGGQNKAKEEGNRITAKQAELTKKQNADLKLATQQAKEATNVADAEANAREKAQRYVEDNFKFADQATKTAYVAQQVEEARAKALKKSADEREREARAAKQAADAARRGYIQDIQDNGREGLVSTAQRFTGFSENNPSQRGDLMSFFKQNGINVDPKMTAWCAAFVNAVLATNGLPGTKSLMARSFLNYGQDAGSNPQNGDIVVLRRGQGETQGHVGFFQGFDDKGGVRVLGGNQGNKVGTQSYRRDDVLGIRRAPSSGQVATQQAREADQLLEKQTAYNEALDNSIERRAADTAQLREQAALQGEALLAKQREAAVEDAVLKARQNAEKAGVDVNSDVFKARLDLLRQTEAAYFDVAHARDTFEAKRTAVDQPVADLTGLRDQLQQQIQFYQESGQTGIANQLQPQLDGVNGQLQEATRNAIAFYQALRPVSEGGVFAGTRVELDAIIQKLQFAMQSSQQWGYIMGISGQQIAQAFASTATSAIDKFAQSVAEGKNVFDSMKNAFLQFAAEFLRQIAQMIIQQLIFNAISSIVKSVAGAPGGGSLDAGQIFHKGGVVGQTAAPSRAISSAWFASAARYHTGGIAGLRSDEVPAILQKGEEVLTRDDPRHRSNGGMGDAAAGQGIKIINAIDAGDMLQKALNSKVGEKVLLNHIRERSSAFRGALG